MDYKQTLMYREIGETPKILQSIAEKNAPVMEKLTAAIRAAKPGTVVGAARGTSDHALIFFKYLTEILTPYRVALSAPGVFTVYGGKSDYTGSLVIGVSQSGKAADVLEVLRTANRQGALTLAVTNDQTSPMAKEAAYHLYCACGEEKSVAATKTFSAQLFLLGWLTAELAGADALRAQLKTLGAELDPKMAGFEKNAGAAAEFLQAYRGGFVLSRGISYALALETALKLQETSYLRMSGYAYSDFQHGPMAMLDAHTPVVFLAPSLGFADAAREDAHTAEVSAVLEKIKSCGAPLLILTDRDGYDAYGKTLYIEKTGSEALSVFRLALTVQLTACRLSCAIGNNPDAPRALKKVTITR
ncbi:MAG: SIS domain-containing protein [Clostridiales bacterium]|jgi:glucosamine--fructose-6-phosphate aminotransferase (isomerizing)|nr:SIS domain-containing protein [Clostridiales bacterium]